jgi:transposase
MPALARLRHIEQNEVAHVFAGIDTHKDTLAVAVIDTAGRVIHQSQQPNHDDGYRRLLAVLTRHGVSRVGIEGSGNYGWPAALYLLDRGLAVVEVPPLLTSRERLARPGQGKTDPVDAVAIARIAAREASLPPVRPMIGAAADLRLLTEYRDQLVTERTALANRVHVDLVWLRPGYHHQLPHLTNRTHLRAALDLLAGDESARAGVTRSRLQRMLELTGQIADLKRKIATLVRATGSQLSGIYGAASIVAGTIIGQVGDVRRYPTRHHFATANGTAPLPASSGRTVRHRLSRGGNRQLNRALYTMAITQIRADTEGRAYYQRKRAEGKTEREALRCLKRRLSDLVYRTMKADLADQASREQSFFKAA